MLDEKRLPEGALPDVDPPSASPENEPDRKNAPENSSARR